MSQRIALPCRQVTMVPLSLLLFAASMVSASASQMYRAAVVEFAPQVAPDPKSLDVDSAKELKLKNLKGLESFAKEAKANGTQIMVFPEYGITGDGFGHPYKDFNRTNVQPFLEVLPSNVTLPCKDAATTSSAPAIAQASCMAKELAMVLVINLLTKEACDAGVDGCPKDGMRVSNTAVAFAEDGQILSLYHKRHPYGDEIHFVDPGDESYKGGVTFTTSFGVKFGMFICFDIVFFTDGGPDALEIIYPTDWVNNVLGPIPDPLSAHVAQRLWSRDHGKNLLAANYGGFGKDSSGSGIWHKGSALASFFNPSKEPQSKLLIADVPVMPVNSNDARVLV